MSEYLSDRMRVECALPAAVFYRLVYNAMIKAGTTEAEEQMVPLFRQARDNVFNGLADDKRKQLLRRTEKLVDEIMDRQEKVAPLVTLLTMVFWVHALLEDQRLILTAGSDLDRALDCIIATLNEPDVQKLWKPFEKGSRRQAMALDRWLQGKGYLSPFQAKLENAA
jgi:hypothetical protein